MILFQNIAPDIALSRWQQFSSSAAADLTVGARSIASPYQVTVPKLQHFRSTRETKVATQEASISRAGVQNLRLHDEALQATEKARMDRDQLRTMQAPLKQRYLTDPASALVTLRAEGTLGENATCNVATTRALVQAGLHPATGGTALAACSGDMLLQALVACAGVTLGAVATALGIELSSGTLTAEGDIDFRGTLAVAKDVPVGFKEIRLYVSLNTNATSSQREKLLALTERYCVVYQTLLSGSKISITSDCGDEPAIGQKHGDCRQ